MIRTQSAPDAMPELPASNGTDSDGTSGRIVAFDRHTRAHPDGRAGAAPAVRVLIADGQALVRAGFRALLESGGRISVVGEASTGEEAVAEARRLRPDVVLLDATLPGLNCVEATGRILADPGIAVMLLTATELDERIFATLRAGARGLLLKDTDPAELVRAVRVLASGAAVLSLLPHRSTRQGGRTWNSAT